MGTPRTFPRVTLLTLVPIYPAIGVPVAKAPRGWPPTPVPPWKLSVPARWIPVSGLGRLVSNSLFVVSL
eukprot:4072922-Pyramimonas_sp.AAC.1